MLTRAAKRQRNANSNQSLKPNVKKEHAEKCASTFKPDDESRLIQESTISKSFIFQLDRTISIKQENYIDEKHLYSSVEQGKYTRLSSIP
jgi:hypothetical protein